MRVHVLCGWGPQELRRGRSSLLTQARGREKSQKCHQMLTRLVSAAWEAAEEKEERARQRELQRRRRIWKWLQAWPRQGCVGSPGEGWWRRLGR